MNETAYVAFLRGINVGGNALIKMSELKKSFEALGFKSVTPVLASGNVIFETESDEELKVRIESMLSRKFEVRAAAMVRSARQIAELIKLNPFQPTKLTPETKVQVTFLAQAKGKADEFPARVPAEQFHIVQVSSSEIYSAIDMSGNARTPELMKFLEKRFGRDITTRTWNTVEKVARLLAC